MCVLNCKITRYVRCPQVWTCVHQKWTVSAGVESNVTSAGAELKGCTTSAECVCIGSCDLCVQLWNWFYVVWCPWAWTCVYCRVQSPQAWESNVISAGAELYAASA